MLSLNALFWLCCWFMHNFVQHKTHTHTHSILPNFPSEHQTRDDFGMCVQDVVIFVVVVVVVAPRTSFEEFLWLSCTKDTKYFVCGFFHFYIVHVCLLFGRVLRLCVSVHMWVWFTPHLNVVYITLGFAWCVENVELKRQRVYIESLRLACSDFCVCGYHIILMLSETGE